MAGPNASLPAHRLHHANKRCTEIYASGLRNPFRFAFDPGSSRASTSTTSARRKWEEVDRAAPAADFGWNVREGPCVRDSRTNCGPPPAGHDEPDPLLRPPLAAAPRSPRARSCPAASWPAAERRRLHVRRPRVREALRADRAAGWRASRAGVRERDGQPDRCARSARTARRKPSTTSSGGSSRTTRSGGSPTWATRTAAPRRSRSHATVRGRAAHGPVRRR